MSSNGISTTPDGSLFAVTTGSLFLYKKEGDLLWTMKGVGGNYAIITSDGKSLISVARSGDGHYIAAGSETVLVFFDNFQAIEEYALSECGQSIRFFTFSSL